MAAGIIALAAWVAQVLLKFLPSNERTRIIGLMKERDDNDKKIDAWENKE